MPQMAPISWLLMFILFLYSFLFLMILTFFNLNISLQKETHYLLLNLQLIENDN